MVRPVCKYSDLGLLSIWNTLILTVTNAISALVISEAESLESSRAYHSGKLRRKQDQ
jgi:hypothetical protein